MLAHGVVGADDDARRRRRARARRAASCTARWWRLATPFALVVSGTAFLVHEQNPWFFERAAFLHHLLGWTLVACALFPLAQRAPAALDARRAGFALTFVAVAVLLYCDRDLAPIFGHLSRSRGCRTDETARRSLAVLAALALPASALRPRDARCEQFPAFRQELSDVAAAVVARASTSRDAAADSILVLDAAGGSTSPGAREGDRRRARSSRPCGRCRAARTRSAGRRSRRTGTSSRESRRSASASAAPPPTEAYGASGPTADGDVVRWLYFLSLALFVGALGFRLLVLPRAAAAGGSSAASTGSRGVGGVAALEVGILAFMLRAEDALQLPFVALPLRRPVADRERDALRPAFIAMTLGFALVLGAARARLADRPAGSLWAAFVLGARLRVRAVALRPLGGRSGRLVALGARRLGAPVRGDPLGRRARPARASSSGRQRGAARATRSSASRGSRPCSSPCCSTAGTYLSHPSAAAPARPLDERLRTRPARQALARRRSRSCGERCTACSPRRGSAQARTAACCGGACSARAPSRWPSSCSRPCSSTPRRRRRRCRRRRPLRREHACAVSTVTVRCSS